MVIFFLPWQKNTIVFSEDNIWLPALSSQKNSTRVPPVSKLKKKRTEVWTTLEFTLSFQRLHRLTDSNILTSASFEGRIIHSWSDSVPVRRDSGQRSLLMKLGWVALPPWPPRRSVPSVCSLPFTLRQTANEVNWHGSRHQGGTVDWKREKV